MQLFERQKRLWAEIDLNAAEYNFKQIKGPVCCVIKADAYGHGSIQLATLFEKLGAYYFAVSNIEEAIQLRNGGITKPILILGYTPINCVSDLKLYNLSQTIYSLDYAKMFSRECEKQNVKIKVHIKIDTGMGRIGFQYHKGINELNQAFEACQMTGIEVEGIFMHFAIADEGINDFTREQYNFFLEAIEYLESKGIFFKIRHCSNSAASIDYPQFHLDMVRAGIVLYGFNPTNSHKNLFHPVLSLKSVVSNVKKIRKGDSISYGRTFIAPKDMMVATIPVGYADGFFRSNSGSCVFLNGQKCKIIGRVCMDQIIVSCDSAHIGDEVEIYGKHIPIEDVSTYNNTIPYEVLCAISKRVPRVYLYNNRIVAIQDNLVWFNYF